MEAPPENFAYTLLLSPDFSKPDALAVIDVKPGSPTFSQIVHTVTMPNLRKSRPSVGLPARGGRRRRRTCDLDHFRAVSMDARRSGCSRCSFNCTPDRLLRKPGPPPVARSGLCLRPETTDP